VDDVKLLKSQRLTVEDDGVIEALRDERDQDVLARRLASDVSLMDVLSKALLLQRLMFAGAKEPNVAANGLATQAVDQQTSLLQQEISNLKTELELRRELASNSPMRVIERGQQRASGSSGVFESAEHASGTADAGGGRGCI
ncbi:hypothetical protein AAIH31_31440, partial [Pseudomonas aeruginosa]